MAHFLGFIGLCFVVYGLITSDKRKVLLAQIVANTMYTCQYIILGFYGTGLICFVTLIRTICFYGSNKPKVYQLILFCVISILCGLVDFNNWLMILPMISSLVFCYGIWQNNLQIFRSCSLINSSCWLIYNFYVGAYMSFISAIIEIVVAAVAILKNKFTKKVRGELNET